MTQEYKGLEMQLCDKWENWDEIDTFTLQFTGVTLNKATAKLVGQEKVDVMIVSGDTSTVEIIKSWDDRAEDSLKFDMKLSLKKVVDTK